MAEENIEGTATDAQGNPLDDATIYVFVEQNTEPDGTKFTGVKTSTDSNGDYVLKDHPAADGTSQEWHVAGFYQDGTGEFNALSKPSVEASVGPKSTLPDSVVSRPDDDDQVNDTKSFGLVINPNSDFDAVGARISTNTSGVTRARLYDYSATSYIETVDISSLSSNDAFKFDSNITSEQDYGIELDANGSTYTVGYGDGDTAYPYTGTDIDIIARSSNGSQVTTKDVLVVNDIGNPDNVLG